MTEEKETILSIREGPVNDITIYCPLIDIEEYIDQHDQELKTTLVFLGKITENDEKHDLYACAYCGFQMLVKVLGIGFYEL